MGHALPLRLELANHSPTGFEWGYSGSGPAKLALAICAQLVDVPTAKAVYQRVKDLLIARIPNDSDAWVLTEQQVREVIERVQAEG